MSTPLNVCRVNGHHSCQLGRVRSRPRSSWLAPRPGPPRHLRTADRWPPRWPATEPWSGPQSTDRGSPVLRTSSSSRGTPDTYWACTPDELRRRGVGQESTCATRRGLTSLHRRPGPTRMLRVSTPGGARSYHRRAAGGPGACHARVLHCRSVPPFAAAAVRGTARYFVLTITCGRSAHQISSWPTTSSWLTRYSFSIAGSSP